MNSSTTFQLAVSLAGLVVLWNQRSRLRVQWPSLLPAMPMAYHTAIPLLIALFLIPVFATPLGGSPAKMAAVSSGILGVLSYTIVRMRKDAPFRWQGSFSAGARAFILAFPLIVLASLLSQLLPSQGSQEAVQILKSSAALERGMAVITSVLVAPFAEECFFRGLLYRWLKSRMPRSNAIVVGALIFALLHFHLPAVLPLTVLAVACTLASEAKGTILAGFFCHMLFNATQVAALLM